MTTAYLNRVATAVPPNDVHEAFVKFAPTLLSDPRHQKLFQRMADRSAILHRYSTLKAAEYADGLSVDYEGFYRRGAFPSTGARMARYEAAALPLVCDAVDQLNPGRHITHLIVTSCTGLYAPGLDLQLIKHLGLRGSVERSFIGFMGCYAAFNALKLARHIVRSEPDAQVLIINVELCTLHLQEVDNLEQVLSFLVFSDGCAASLVTGNPEGIALNRFRTVLLPETHDLITWRISDQGFDMFLSGQVPIAISAGLKGAVPEILDGATVDAIDVWAIHPGGKTVLDAVETALELKSAKLTTSRDVLAHYGNMSSATIMFVLQQLLETAKSGDQGCAMGFGPGLTAETMLFQKVT